MKTYRLGVASMVHDHVWGELRHWAQMPNVQIVAAADPNEELREKIRAEYGVQELYDSPGEMIAKANLDIVQAASENATTAEIIEAAAAKGLDIISEKPMSARLSQADRMLKAANDGGVKLLINWPNIWSPQFQTMDRLILDGAIGRPFNVKYRSAHNGPKEIGCSKYFWGWLYDEELNGAGALMDYCCYGAAKSARWLGRAKSCIGFRGVLVKDYPIPDDNAVIIAKYDDAYALCEASWTQKVGTPGANPLVYGTEGALGIMGDELLMWKPGDTPKALEPTVVDLDEVPEHRKRAPQYLIWCIENDQEPEGVCNAQISRNAQEILEAGLLSADSGKEIAIPIEG